VFLYLTYDYISDQKSASCLESRIDCLLKEAERKCSEIKLILNLTLATTSSTSSSQQKVQRFNSLYSSHVTCHMSHVTCHMSRFHKTQQFFTETIFFRINFIIIEVS